MSRCQKKASSGLDGAREENNRQTRRQSGWAPLHPDQSAIHLHQSTHFYTGCPSCCNPPNLSWLETGTGICCIAYPHGLLHPRGLVTSMALCIISNHNRQEQIFTGLSVLINKLISFWPMATTSYIKHIAHLIN